jgi:thioredoxin 1
VFDAPLTTTDQSLDRVLAAGLPVALVFLDGGSGLDDRLARLAREEAGKLLVVKVHAADSPAAVSRYGVRGLPAVVTVRQGQVKSQAERISARDLEQHVAYLLERGPRPQQAAASPAGPGPASHTAGTGRPLEVSDGSFEQDVLRSPLPVLIDFWAPWCGPCGMVAPVVEKLAAEMPGELRVVKINVDDNPDVSMSYGVQSIPTMMIVRQGQVVDRWVGAQPENAIRARVLRALNAGR